MATLTERLLQLAAQHEAKAAALRLAASELNGHAKEHAAVALPGKLAGAIAVRNKNLAANIQDTRNRMAALLDKIAQSGGTPYPADKVGRSGPPLVQAGYLQRVEDGYLRTAKTYIVSKYQAKMASQHAAAPKKKIGRPSTRGLQARLDAVKRPEPYDRAFPRWKGPVTEYNVARFEQRVKDYWAEQ